MDSTRGGPSASWTQNSEERNQDIQPNGICLSMGNSMAHQGVKSAPIRAKLLPNTPKQGSAKSRILKALKHMNGSQSGTWAQQARKTIHHNNKFKPRKKRKLDDIIEQSWAFLRRTNQIPANTKSPRSQTANSSVAASLLVASTPDAHALCRNRPAIRSKFSRDPEDFLGLKDVYRTSTLLPQIIVKNKKLLQPVVDDNFATGALNDKGVFPPWPHSHFIDEDDDPMDCYIIAENEKDPIVYEISSGTSEHSRDSLLGRTLPSPANSFGSDNHLRIIESPNKSGSSAEEADEIGVPLDWTISHKATLELRDSEETPVSTMNQHVVANTCGQNDLSTPQQSPSSKPCLLADTNSIVRNHDYDLTMQPQTSSRDVTERFIAAGTGELAATDINIPFHATPSNSVTARLQSEVTLLSNCGQGVMSPMCALNELTRNTRALDRSIRGVNESMYKNALPEKAAGGRTGLSPVLCGSSELLHDHMYTQISNHESWQAAKSLDEKSLTGQEEGSKPVENFTSRGTIISDYQRSSNIRTEYCEPAENCTLLEDPAHASTENSACQNSATPSSKNSPKLPPSIPSTMMPGRVPVHAGNSSRQNSTMPSSKESPLLASISSTLLLRQFKLKNCALIKDPEHMSTDNISSAAASSKDSNPSVMIPSTSWYGQLNCTVPEDQDSTPVENCQNVSSALTLGQFESERECILLLDQEPTDVGNRSCGSDSTSSSKGSPRATARSSITLKLGPSESREAQRCQQPTACTSELENSDGAETAMAAESSGIEDLDEDALFMQSMIPALKRIEQRARFEIKMKIMRTIYEATYKSQNTA